MPNFIIIILAKPLEQGYQLLRIPQVEIAYGVSFEIIMTKIIIIVIDAIALDLQSVTSHYLQCAHPPVLNVDNKYEAKRLNIKLHTLVVTWKQGWIRTFEKDEGDAQNLSTLLLNYG